METVCLKCGDRGFPETLVSCNECQACALHRYCLDGPVIFWEEFIWFCEDCEAKQGESSFRDKSIHISSETGDSISLTHDTINARKDLKNCTNRVKKNNQQAHKLIEEEKQKKRNAVNHELNCVELDHGVSAQPIANPIWRGSFDFCNETIGIVDGLLAHMSSLACYKVLEETKLLSEVICADLLPRSAVWPKSFEIRGPTDQSIALYFFPESERDEKAFAKLVNETIQLELAIRAVAENAELLIFPSTVLPLTHRRFQDKYYLWGVFRVKQTSHKTNDAVCREDASVDKLLTRHNLSLSNTLSSSGSDDSHA